MSTTLRTLCEEYHLSTPDGTSALQSSGILVVRVQAPSRPNPPRRRRGRLLFCRPRHPRAQHPGPPLWITNSVSARS